MGRGQLYEFQQGQMLGPAIGCEAMASSCVRGSLDWILEKFLYCKSGQALEQAAQGGG